MWLITHWSIKSAVNVIVYYCYYLFIYKSILLWDEYLNLYIDKLFSNFDTGKSTGSKLANLTRTWIWIGFDERMCEYKWTKFVFNFKINYYRGNYSFYFFYCYWFQFISDVNNFGNLFKERTGISNTFPIIYQLFNRS